MKKDKSNPERHHENYGCKKVEETESFRELKSIFKNLPIGIVYLDNEFRIISSNRFFNDFTGFQEQELKGKICYEIVGEYSDDPTKRGPEKICSFCKKVECFKYKRPTVMERPLQDKFIRVTTVPELNKKGEIRRFIEIVEDITERRKADEALKKVKNELELRVKERTEELSSTVNFLQCEVIERKKAEEQIKASLKEKEVLMQEIHHRVKNNLTVISSLLMLQSFKIADKQYKEIFDDSINRIKTMALIHEKLYHSGDLARIVFGDYLEDMVDDMYIFYGLNACNIALIKDIDKITLGLDTSIPCGLIVNELLSNSMKHAFPDSRNGEVIVAFHGNDKDEVELTIGDNGIGMPEGLDFRKTDSLGLNLVTTLVKQLQGKIELRGDRGTKFHVTFRRCQ
ncbi:MAG: PAS domain S-box protein [Nitrospirae bacterium]|nr:PAS domain S-box protein [Nitrospirota bacterium]